MTIASAVTARERPDVALVGLGESPEHALGRGVLDKHDGDRERRACQLNHRVAGTDRLVALATAPPQHQPAEHGDVVVGPHWLAAPGAVRPGDGERLAARQAIDDDVEERADGEACHHRQQDHHHAGTPDASDGIGRV